MVRRFGLAILTLGVLSSFSSGALAQDVLSELYGKGVHAFYSGDYNTSLEFLNDAVNAGSKDPRVYYYRGLVQSNLGMSDAAATDFDQGAQLEVTSKRAVEVGKALIRVQGANRVAIETARRKARLQAQAAKAQIAQEQYESVKKGDETVVRPKDATPPVIETKPEVAANDPFANPEKMKEGEAAVETEKPGTAEPAAPAEGSDPFGDDAKPADEKPAPAGDDPFGSSGGAAPAAGDDPFGGN